MAKHSSMQRASSAKSTWLVWRNGALSLPAIVPSHRRSKRTDDVSVCNSRNLRAKQSPVGGVSLSRLQVFSSSVGVPRGVRRVQCAADKQRHDGKGEQNRLHHTAPIDHSRLGLDPATMSTTVDVRNGSDSDIRILPESKPPCSDPGADFPDVYLAWKADSRRSCAIECGCDGQYHHETDKAHQ